jgi:hypothetical protein
LLFATVGGEPHSPSDSTGSFAHGHFTNSVSIPQSRPNEVDDGDGGSIASGRSHVPVGEQARRDGGRPQLSNTYGFERIEAWLISFLPNLQDQDVNPVNVTERRSNLYEYQV